MSRQREYEIAYVGLKPGVHELNYEITDKFFALYQEQDFNNCQAKVKLSLDKKNGFMLLRFEIGGTISTFCDRCGNPLELELWDEFNITVKMVEEPEMMNNEEDDPDVYYIGRNESHIYVADWIYEFINLSIPARKLCGTDEEGNDKCNQEIVSRLNNNIETENSKNPLWEGLQKFKDLEN